MKSTFKPLIFTALTGLFLLLGSNTYAQTSCCSGESHDKASCTADHGKGVKDKSSCSTASVASTESTSGCSPKSCRGAKTKFGEAMVITNLRSELIALKADMEKSTNPSFDAKSYDIHGIVGENDDQSLDIIVREVKIVEQAFAQKLNYSAPTFDLPESKAKKVQYLSSRIESLKGLLL
ncbi:MAG: hypothetical protein AAF489_03490 [Bacteroidota bacterium]